MSVLSLAIFQIISPKTHILNSLLNARPWFCSHQILRFQTDLQWLLKHWAGKRLHRDSARWCFNCVWKDTRSYADIFPHREQEGMCDVIPLGIPLPTKVGNLPLKVGAAVGCSAVTFFSHLFWMSTIHPSVLKEFSNSTLTLNAAHWFSVTHRK